MPRRKLRITLASLIVLVAPALSIATDPEKDAGSSPARVRFEQRTFVLFPEGDFFPPAIAGPHQRGFALTVSHVADTDIPAVGDRIFGLKLGAVFGLVRVHPNGRPDRGWQLGIDGGFHGQFDIDNSSDSVGWDGFYGLVFSRSLGDRLALKLATHHTSSHVGDEYAERTGRKRIDYTREELATGVSWRFAPRWRTYGELAHAFELRNKDLQDEGRVQWGMEYQADDTLWRGRLGWYAAIDANAYEESDWDPDLSAQAGLATWVGVRRWRLGVEYYDGRTPLGEFSFRDQRLVTIGLYFDLAARAPAPR